MRTFTCKTCQRAYRVILPYAICPTCSVIRRETVAKDAAPPTGLSGKDLCSFYMEIEK